MSSSTSFSVRTVNSVMDEVMHGSGKRVWLVVTLGWKDNDFWIVETVVEKGDKVICKGRGGSHGREGWGQSCCERASQQP